MYVVPLCRFGWCCIPLQLDCTGPSHVTLVLIITQTFFLACKARRQLKTFSVWCPYRAVHETAGNFPASPHGEDYYRPKPQPRNEWSSGDTLPDPYGKSGGTTPPGPFRPSGDNRPGNYGPGGGNIPASSSPSGDHPTAPGQRLPTNAYPYNYPASESPVQYVNYQEQPPRYANHPEQPPRHPPAATPTHSACK